MDTPASLPKNRLVSWFDRLRSHLKTASQKSDATTLIRDLRTMDFALEVFPFRRVPVAGLISDVTFWSIFVVIITPLLLVTLNGTSLQQTGFALFVAIIWGWVMSRFVIRVPVSWKTNLLSFFFTGLVGIRLLVYFYDHLPPSFMNLPQSDNLWVSLFGQVFRTALWEELCKILPVLILVLWKKGRVTVWEVVTTGVFSGLGFGAFETMVYADSAITTSALGTRDAMIMMLLRSMSLVFGHAMYSGILAYFVAVGIRDKNRRLALFLVGLAVASLFHGTYNWSWQIQAVLPALVMGLCYFVFNGYLMLLRLTSENPAVELPVLDATSPAIPANQPEQAGQG